jgi:hypothetical protein
MIASTRVMSRRGRNISFFVIKKQEKYGYLGNNYYFCGRKQVMVQ